MPHPSENSLILHVLPINQALSYSKVQFFFNAFSISNLLLFYVIGASRD